MKEVNAIGLMSGTSMDGIDACILKTNGIEFKRYDANMSGQYGKKTKNILQIAEKDPINFFKNKEILNNANRLVTIDHIKLINRIINKHSIDIQLIGFHGQTIFHNFEKKTSIQISDPQFIANQTKINVVSDFRNKDLIQGGQGAPIAPIYHQAIIKKMNLILPACLINIGGVANLTYWDGQNLVGFDTGPGNGLLDKFIKTRINKNYDKNGSIANRGVVNKGLLKLFQEELFFELSPPKSLDKLSFFHILDNKILKSLNTRDGASTLSLLTVETIYKSIKFLPKTPRIYVVMGGGAKNNFIIRKLKEKINYELYTADQLELPGQYIEAELIAFLAARRINNLPITFPSTTGVNNPSIGGKIYEFK